MARPTLTPNNREEEDAYNDPTQTSRQLNDAESESGSEPSEQEGYDSDVAKNNGDSGAALREREEKSGTGAGPIAYERATKTVSKGRQLFKSISGLKRAGPLTAVAVFVVAGFIISAASFPVLVLQHIEETFTKALNDADPSINVRTKLAFKLKADAVRNGFAESADGKCNIKCKFSTINSKTKRRMEASNGVKFELDKKVGGRYVIKSMTFPAEGTKPEVKITNGDDFALAMKDPVRASSFYRVFNPSSDPFLAYNFVARLTDRFGLTKKTTLDGETEQENRDKLSRSLGVEEDTNGNGNGNNGNGDDEEKINSGSSKEVGAAVDAGKVKLSGLGGGAAKANDVAGAVCAAYDVGKGINVAYNVYKFSQYTTLFMAIANTASDARVGTLKPGSMTLIGNLVTQVDNNKKYSDDGVSKTNPFYKKSFTDSAGYKMAAFGDSIKLSDRDKRYGSSPTGVTGFINQMTGFLNATGDAKPGVLVASNQTCKLANSPVGVALSCLPEVLAGSVVPIAGNAAALIICIGVGLVVGEVISQALQIMLPGIISNIVKNDLGAFDKNLAGPGLGDAAYVGAGAILGSGMSSMYGLTPGTNDEVASYKVATAQVRADYAAAEKYAASSDPLNVNNQYSFLGSFIRSSGMLDANLSSGTGAINWVSALTSSAASIITPSTYAASSEAELYKDGTDCPDTGLQEIGVACNSFGMPSFVMSDTELNADVAETADSMLDPATNDGQTSYIDEDTGEPTAGTDYAKFVQYCSNRQVSYGQTTGSIADDDFAWETGYACTCTEEKVDGLICTDELASKVHLFRTFTMDKTINDAIDDTVPGQAGATDDGTTEGSNVPDGTPTDDGTGGISYVLSPANIVGTMGRLFDFRQMKVRA